MRSLIVIPLFCALAVCLLGCQHRPFLMRGAMNVNGNVGMDGNINMTGNMSIKNDNTASRIKPVVVSGSAGLCKRIAVVDVDGLLIDKNVSGMGSMGENPVALFREKLKAIEKDHGIAAIVLRINSPGGGVTASDIMSNDLKRLTEKRNIPVVACIMATGAGGAYYLASHADRVFAHPTSVVGGIGVILNTYNLELIMGQFNILSNPIKSGDKIDLISPERPLDDDEREILEKMASDFHQRFIDQVQSSRGDLDSDNEVFDGRVYSGVSAKENNLVDRVGYLDDAIDYAKQLSGAGSDASIVMFRRDNDRAYTVLDVTPNDAIGTSLIPIKIPGLDRSAMPTFMYLWQSDSSLGSAIR